MPDLTPEEFRRLGHRFVDRVADHRAGLDDQPVRDDVVPGSVRDRFDPEAADGPRPLDELPGLVQDVVGGADTRWQHPGFHAFFPANASLTSLLGEILSSGLGAQGMLWSTSPACTEVEQAVTDQLARALGIGEAFTHDGGGGGVIQDSASSAVLVALLAALHRGSDGSWRETGVTGTERVYLTADTHSALAKAARVAGLGARGLRTVPIAPGTRTMDPDAFAALLDADLAEGLRPVLVCPTVGTTGTGAVDPVGRRRGRRPAPRGVGARGRRVGRRRRALPGVCAPARRRGARRLALNERAQVADDGVRRVAAVRTGGTTVRRRAARSCRASRTPPGSRSGHRARCATAAPARTPV